MTRAICPECCEVFEIGAVIIAGDVIECPECGSEFVIRLVALIDEMVEHVEDI